ncbi:MAG TPA: inositol monophosphatase family protein [Polyangiaceae bacterium]|nr:inositol monophosphatase family protein [Polyangiaceae bacterium]
MTDPTPPALDVDADELLRVALDAAREAADLVKVAWRKHPAAEHKGRTDLVTRFDRESETLLHDRLTQATPYPIVGEEHGGEKALGPDARTWYVDPIDGTTNFVHGHPFWCVSVGLLAGTRPLVGAVVAPALGTEWTAVVGREAKRNGEVCRVSSVARIEDALLATGFPYDRSSNLENNFDAFVAIKKKAQAVRRCGSAALDLCLVADGTYDGYWENKLKVWDVAAGTAIVLAAGGRVSNYVGDRADVNVGQIIATNGHLHDPLIEELNDVARRR